MAFFLFKDLNELQIFSKKVFITMTTEVGRETAFSHLKAIFVC